ncbi:hypothetical protein M3Y98_00840800 [Aphelenchoides besseyi]|nr:hypothetical protein M3Y98_00840800 [Aphelenchoides besseyi]KAI6195513.1 hypothetical protein M3Y96_01239300 [Aphelenchoides besseyi]
MNQQEPVQQSRPLPKWIECWLFFSTITCAFDAAYTFLWPKSQDGGAWTVIFYFWHLYSTVDTRYKDPTDEVLRSHEQMMLVEIVINLIAVVSNHRYSPHTKLVAFMVSAFTFWKTVAYLLMYVNGKTYLNPAAPTWKVISVFWIPNSLWIIVPLILMRSLWHRLVPAAPANLLHANKRSADEGPHVHSNLLTGSIQS